MEAIIAASRQYLTEDEHDLVAAQMRFSVERRKLYPDKFKAFAISVYFKSPACYHFLATRFRLPARSTIHLWLSKLKFSQGICSNLFKMLALRVQRLPPNDRACVVLADEMSLKKSVEYCKTTDAV